MKKYKRNPVKEPNAILRKDGIVLKSVPVESLRCRIPLFATLYSESCDGYPVVGIQITEKAEDKDSFPVSLFIDCPGFISDLNILRCDLACIASYNVRWDPETEVLFIEDLPRKFDQ